MSEETEADSFGVEGAYHERQGLLYSRRGMHTLAADHFGLAAGYYGMANLGALPDVMLARAQAERDQVRPTPPPNVAGLVD